MCMSARSGNEHAVVLRLVTTQQQYVADAKELKVNEFIFYILYCGTAAYHMWHHGDVEFLLYCCCNGDSARAAAQSQTLKLSVRQFAIDILRMVSRDVYKHWLELLQFVNSAEKTLRSASFQRRQHLKREMSAASKYRFKVYSTHSKMSICLQSYEKSSAKQKKIILFLPRQSKFSTLVAKLRKVECKSKEKSFFFVEQSYFIM